MISHAAVLVQAPIFLRGSGLWNLLISSEIRKFTPGMVLNSPVENGHFVHYHQLVISEASREWPWVFVAGWTSSSSWMDPKGFQSLFFYLTCLVIVFQFYRLLMYPENCRKHRFSSDKVGMLLNLFVNKPFIPDNSWLFGSFFMSLQFLPLNRAMMKRASGSSSRPCPFRMFFASGRQQMYINTFTCIEYMIYLLI